MTKQRQQHIFISQQKDMKIPSQNNTQHKNIQHAHWLSITAHNLILLDFKYINYADHLHLLLEAQVTQTSNEYDFP